MKHIKAFISYIDDEDGSKEPALCITTKKHDPKLVAIGLSKAWAYTSDTYLIKKSKEFAEYLGLGDTWFETRNIADVIMNGLDSLCEAPEYEMVKQDRVNNKPVAGEVKIMSGDETLYEQELR